jgi:hypothetical protein
MNRVVAALETNLNTQIKSQKSGPTTVQQITKEKLAASETQTFSACATNRPISDGNLRSILRKTRAPSPVVISVDMLSRHLS